MEPNDVIPYAGPLAAVAGSIWAVLKSKSGQAFLRRVLSLDDLDSKVTAAVEIAVSALQAALDARGEELTRLEREIDELRTEVASLRTSDLAKDRRIQELEREVEELRVENAKLRAELEARKNS